MRKFLLAFILAVSLVTVSLVSAADDYYLPLTGTLRDSTFIQWRDAGWSGIKHDTVTIHAKYGDSLLDLGSKYYNFIIKSLNGAGDSGSVKIAFPSYGIWHADSVARNLDYTAVGLNSADDNLIIPLGSRYIYIRPVVGGHHDSTCLLDIWCIH